MFSYPSTIFLSISAFSFHTQLLHILPRLLPNYQANGINAMELSVK